MKEGELRKHSTCSLCKQKIGKSGLPLFYRLTIERFGVKMDAVERQTGLAMMLGGNGFLAGVMGPDEDMAMPLMDKLTLVICELCAGEPTNFWVHRLAETESTVIEPKMERIV